MACLYRAERVCMFWSSFVHLVGNLAFTKECAVNGILPAKRSLKSHAGDMFDCEIKECSILNYFVLSGCDVPVSACGIVIGI